MKKLFKRILQTVVIILIVSVLAIWGLGYRTYKNLVAETSIQTKIEEVRNREYFISYDKLPQIFIDATVNTEDERLWSRDTVLDFRALGRAFITNVKSFKLLEGGSTIPQQVSKNLYFDYKPSAIRKVAEYYITKDLLKEYGKDTMVEMYVNVSYYGHGAYGIGEATHKYFNKDISKLNEGELTILAGLVQAPSVYDLTKNYDLARKRQKHVISRLVDNEVITETQGNEIFNMEVRGYEKND